MTITVSEDICNKNGIRIDEVLAILLVKSTDDVPKLFKSLEDKDILVKDMFGNYMVTQRWDDIVSSILLDSDKASQPESRIDSLATQLMEVFPKGKKEGTCHYFKCNKKDISLKLKKFFKLYGNKFTDEQIVNAARAYVSSFNGNYRYMRILKYFIWKDEKKIDSEGSGYVEEVSDLASWIENEGGDINGSDWTGTML